MRTLIIAAFALGLLACKSREESQTPYGTEPTDQGQPVREVVKDPEYGEKVTVEGKVDQVYSPQSFTMKAGIFQDNLLVIAPKELVVEALAAPQQVQVTGTVKKMVVAEVEREFELDFDNAVEVQWENQPYLVAESLQRMPEGAD